MGRGTVMVRAPLVPAALVGMLTICALALSSIYSGELMARLLIGAAAVAVAISLAVKRLPALADRADPDRAAAGHRHCAGARDLARRAGQRRDRAARAARAARLRTAGRPLRRRALPGGAQRAAGALAVPGVRRLRRDRARRKRRCQHRGPR